MFDTRLLCTLSRLVEPVPPMDLDANPATARKQGRPSGAGTRVKSHALPYGVLVVDRSVTRFFRYWLGEIVEQEQDRFELDLSQWRRWKPVAGRGADRDSVRQRVDTQHVRFFNETAERPHPVGGLAAWLVCVR